MNTQKRTYRKLMPNGAVQFSRGARIITRKRTETEALPALRFLMLRRGLDEAGYQAFLETKRANGWPDPFELQELADHYASLSRRKPRKANLTGISATESEQVAGKSTQVTCPHCGKAHPVPANLPKRF